MKFCFSTYSTLLVRCNKPTVTQKELITKLIAIINKEYADCELDDAAISCFVRGFRNLSPKIVVYARNCKVADVAAAFSDTIIPLIDQNKSLNLVLALKDLIAQDNDIVDSAIVEYISRLTKQQFLAKSEISLEECLPGLFLYVLVNAKNIGTNSYVKLLTDEYISSFNKTNINLKINSALFGVQVPGEEINSVTEYFFDDNVLEKARLFCIKFEREKHLLPICEIAAILQPKHKHSSPIIDAFNKESKDVQQAILISESLKPYKHCSWEKIHQCVNEFEKEIKEKKYCTVEFLYDGAKYFHRAFQQYADYELRNINPYIFNRKYMEEKIKNVKGSLWNFIEDYDFVREYHPEEIKTPPFDVLWYGMDLANCEEVDLVFWIVRFIITLCHYLHGIDINAEYDENKNIKDTVIEEEITIMEEFYYYALFLLYEAYGDE